MYSSSNVEAARSELGSNTTSAIEVVCDRYSYNTIEFSSVGLNNVAILSDSDEPEKDKMVFKSRNASDPSFKTIEPAALRFLENG